MSQWIRVFFSDNGTLTDYSLESSNKQAFSVPMVAAEDFIYVGQQFPFNNFHLEIGTANDQASNMTVQYWTNKEWLDMVDILDGSKSSGNTIAQDGVVQFSPDRQTTWSITSDTTEGTNPPELTSIELYNLYWARIKVSTDLNASTTIKQIAYAFCTDEDLTALDPEINDFLTSWKSGKTSWLEQIKVASRMVVSDLKSRSLILHSGNIIRFDDYNLPTAFRTLANIYSVLGENYKDRRDWAIERYKAELEIKRHTVDIDRDAVEDRGEVSNVVTRGIR